MWFNEKLLYNSFISVAVEDVCEVLYQEKKGLGNKPQCLDLKIPNAFTPSVPGNTVWNIQGLQKYSEVTVRIFNRWGNLVYESEGEYKPWDGRRNGKLLPSGTYYYIIDLSANQEPLTGSVTILK